MKCNRCGDDATSNDEIFFTMQRSDTGLYKPTAESENLCKMCAKDFVINDGLSILVSLKRVASPVQTEDDV